MNNRLYGNVIVTEQAIADAAIDMERFAKEDLSRKLAVAIIDRFIKSRWLPYRNKEQGDRIGGGMVPLMPKEKEFFVDVVILTPEEYCELVRKAADKERGL
jgi:hypothetical protein